MPWRERPGLALVVGGRVQGETSEWGGLGECDRGETAKGKREAKTSEERGGGAEQVAWWKKGRERRSKITAGDKAEMWKVDKGLG